MNAEQAHLLLVEDDETIRSVVGRYLQAKGLSVTGVAGGEDALAALGRGPYDLVLLDTLLPDISGLEVLQRLRRDYALADLPVIMATARDRSADVVEALRLGANDYLTKPFDFAVALARIQTHVALKRSVERIRRLEQSLAQRNAELEQANARLEEANQRMRHDLEAAAKVQQALLPEGPPPIPGVNFAWQFKPCTELGGDLLNVVVLDDGRVALYVLDVTGHGVKAALLAVMVSRVLIQLLWPWGVGPRAAGGAVGASAQQRLTSPAEVATRLNGVFPWDERTGQFCTLLYGVLSVDTGVFTFVSAGHPGPVYLPRAGKARILDAYGGLIGLGRAGYQESSLTLQAGDRLYLYTDGLPEAPSREGECFGEERLVHVLEQGRSLPLQDSLSALVQHVEGWSGSEAPADDISVLAVELAGEGPRGEDRG